MYVTHLFNSLLNRHNITARSSKQSGNDSANLLALLHASPALQNAALAVAALNFDLYKASVNRHSIRSRDARRALQHYHDAVVVLRRDIVDYETSGPPEAKCKARLLWTTLLLAIFELMYDGTKHGFMTHFVHGTTVLGQDVRVDRSRSLKLDPTLFDTVRMFELMRAFTCWLAANFSCAVLLACSSKTRVRSSLSRCSQ